MVRIRGRHAVAGIVGCAVALAITATPSRAATSSVTLHVDPSSIVYGSPSTLWGHVSPRHRGERVKILDQDGRVIRRTTTGRRGTYSVTIRPRRSMWVRAEWKGVASPRVYLRVRARVRVLLSRTLLFGTALASGRVAPATAGARVEVTLMHGGAAVAHARPRMTADGTFRARLHVRAPGIYRARASFRDDDRALGTALSPPQATPLPRLGVGAHGPVVKLLERRLVSLHYRLVGVDRRYDARTAAAVLAFRKVQRMARVATVDPAVWRALAAPRRPTPRLRTKPRHIEVNQAVQVLYVVVGGKIEWIVHVSTGKPSTPTRDGRFRVFRKVAGFSSHHLYYPSFFDGARAIHGWPDVPPYPASHGCVRIPLWVAKWMFTQDPIGTRVLVYG